MNAILTHERYAELAEAWLAAWNQSDARAVASFYAEECDYRDPSVPNGIRTRAALERYLRLLFHRWPRQEWTLQQIMPHEERGQFSATYTFRFGNRKGTREVRGNGMDFIRFTGAEVAANWVFLNAEGWTDFTDARKSDRVLEQVESGE